MQLCNALLIAALMFSACWTPAMAQEKRGLTADAGKVCPRCGYLVENGWSFCAACGWDLRVLVGSEAASRLKAVGASVVGLVVTRKATSIRGMVPNKVLEKLYAYNVFTRPGQTRQYATAFPFLKPGLFITRARSLERAESLEVRTYNNRLLPAQVLGYDILTGIGVIKAEVPGATLPEVSDRAPRESDLTWAICFPITGDWVKMEYLPEAFHRGRISFVGREGIGLMAFGDLVRTDHTLERGCFGGPIFDAYGATVGLVVDSTEPGITYALPIASLKRTVEVLAEGKQPEYPFFGIGLVAPDDRRKAKFNLPMDCNQPLIAYVTPNSPSQEAGILPGDLLSAVGGEQVTSVAAAGSKLLESVPLGQAIELVLQRKGKQISVSVVPIRRPARVMMAPSDELEESLEANLEEITTGLTSQQGLRIARLARGGRGEKEGYRVGDSIIAVYGKPVRHREIFDEIVEATNVHLFGEKVDSAKEAPQFSTYVMPLGIRSAEKGERMEKIYMNLFPDVYTAPTY